MCYLLRMNDQGSDGGARRDALLLRLLKMPPQTRTETAETVPRAKGNPTDFARSAPAQEFLGQSMR